MFPAVFDLTLAVNVKMPPLGAKHCRVMRRQLAHGVPLCNKNFQYMLDFEPEQTFDVST